ncbi:MAG: M81 family metallopeptidase [Planktomarina sp.]|nr:M81 family metallopeptidase [Planktomarina sp.]
MVKLFIATFGTESNTFATYPAGKADFLDGLWCKTGISNAPVSPWSGPAKVWYDRAAALGWNIVEGLHAFAQPAGTLSRKFYEDARDSILNDLRAAGPVDAVLFYLHGAMVAQGYDDCEGDLVARARAIIGADTKLGIELDLHAHMGQTLVDSADLIVLFKTYPHIDHNDRAHDLFELMQRTLSGDINPTMALFDCKTMGLFPTTRSGPMPRFVADMIDAEGQGGILSLSLNHGFPWADVPLAGAKMLAITDDDPKYAGDIAEEFGRAFFSIRQAAALEFTSMDEAVEIAARSQGKAVLLADVSDQTGGGAPGDTCYMVRAFLDAGITRATFGPIWDPAAVEMSFQLGLQAKTLLRVGGKSEPQSGPPLDIDVEIIFLKREASQESDGTEDVPIGDIAVIRCKGVDIVLTSIRTNVYSPSFFTNHGICLTDKQVIGVKNLFKHTDIFAPLVQTQFYVATPGVCQPDFWRLDFKKLCRPIWPLDDDTLLALQN